MKFPHFGASGENTDSDNIKRDHLGSGSWIPYTVAACSAVVLYTLINNIPVIGNVFSRMLQVLNPVIIGIVVAYLMTPFVRWIDRALSTQVRNDRVRNWIAIIIAFAVIIVFAAILLYSLIPQLIDSAMQFINNINGYALALNQVADSLASIADEHGIQLDGLLDLGTDFVTKAVQFLTSNAGTVVGRSFSLGGDAFGLLIGVIIAIYFLLSKKLLLNGVNRLMKLLMREQRYVSVTHFLARCNNIVIKFIIDDLIDALIVGAANIVFMTIMHMPYTVLIAVVCGVTNLAPTFGPFVGAFIGGFVLLCAEPSAVIPFEIFTLCLQLCDGYVIKPKLFGDTLGVPGVWMVSGIIIGGELFGVIGILMAVPVTGILTFVYRDIVDALEEKVTREREAERAALEAEEAEGAVVSEAAAAANKAVLEADEESMSEVLAAEKEVVLEVLTAQNEAVSEVAAAEEESMSKVSSAGDAETKADDGTRAKKSD